MGSRLVQSVLEFAESEESKELVSGGVKEVMLHVQISNEDAMKFYDRLGFEKGEMVENYYKRIDPPHCYVLRKKL